MRSPSVWLVAALLQALEGSAQAEYCVGYSSGVKSLARQAGSLQSRSCFSTEAQCNSARWSRPGDFSGMCSYQPGLYPPTQNRSGGTGISGTDQATKASADAQKKIQAQQQADEQAASRALQDARQDLMQGLHGVEASTGAIAIKLPPPVSAGKARQQLDCVTRASEASAQTNVAPQEPGAQYDFGNASDCRPQGAAIAPVPAPVATTTDGVPADRAEFAQFLRDLAARIGQARAQLSALDREVAQLENQIAHPEPQASALELKTAPTTESDALRRAREALAKARADRQKAATEYEKLQQQEQLAHQRQAAP